NGRRERPSSDPGDAAAELRGPFPFARPLASLYAVPGRAPGLHAAVFARLRTHALGRDQEHAVSPRPASRNRILADTGGRQSRAARGPTGRVPQAHPDARSVASACRESAVVRARVPGIVPADQPVGRLLLASTPAGRAAAGARRARRWYSDRDVHLQ